MREEKYEVRRLGTHPQPAPARPQGIGVLPLIPMTTNDNISGFDAGRVSSRLARRRRWAINSRVTPHAPLLPI